MIEGRAKDILLTAGVLPPSKAAPCLRFDAEVADIAAVQALNRGDAAPDQQKRALDWIITQLAAAGATTFQPDSTHATAFAEGRRYVGLKLARALAVSMRDLRSP